MFVFSLFAQYTYEDILDEVQASESQIRQHLHALEACEIDGHWRLLDNDYKGKVLEHIVSLREENGWSWNDVPLAGCLETLTDLFDRLGVS